MNKKVERTLFNDSYNSLAHVGLGALSTYFSFIIPMFLSYQMFEYVKKSDDLVVDVSEFAIGFWGTKILLFFLITKK